MGDFTPTEIGENNTGYEEVLWRHGVGEISDNGEKFTNFCALNSLVIGGSIFLHKTIHKVTWVSSGNSTENPIDDICINKKFRRSLQDVCVRRGVDVLVSGHHLVITRVKLKLKKKKKMKKKMKKKKKKMKKKKKKKKKNNNNNNNKSTRTDFKISSKFFKNK